MRRLKTCVPGTIAADAKYCVLTSWWFSVCYFVFNVPEARPYESGGCRLETCFPGACGVSPLRSAGGAQGGRGLAGGGGEDEAGEEVVVVEVGECFGTYTNSKDGDGVAGVAHGGEAYACGVVDETENFDGE